MSRNQSLPASHNILLPSIDALTVNANRACVLSTDGELKTLTHEQARMALHRKPVLVCHAPYTRARLQTKDLFGFDVLELYAFVHPARFCVPTPHGLCKALGLSAPASADDMPGALFDITRALLQDLSFDPYKAKADPLSIAAVMGLNGKGWPWAKYMHAALGASYDAAAIVTGKTSLNVWRHLPEWAEEAPEPPAGHFGVSAGEATERLERLLQQGEGRPEAREEQKEYAAHIAKMFAPAENIETPHVVLAEAGTGVGKTLGYIAPASVWAEKNNGPVWISTYTKNLQRQINQELDRLYPDPELKDLHVGIRKGRENYLCLLNFEDTAAGAGLAHHINHAVGAGLMARWIAASKDGDMHGGDFPGWLPSLIGFQYSTGLADRRGECIYSACDHYHRCFVEHSVRKSKRARIVVANHALVMIQSALSQPGDDLPGRYIFDEGHHLFSAADSAFAGHLSARESRDLRRWILGAEGGRKSRARGLTRRAEDLLEGDAKGLEILQEILHRAGMLSAEGWAKRLKDSAPMGPAEQFFMLVYKQVQARARGRDEGYSLECEVHPMIELIPKCGRELRLALTALQAPMNALAGLFRRKLADDAGLLDGDTRRRLESLAAAIERRSRMTLQHWIEILESMEYGYTRAQFVDWMEVERMDGQSVDIGLYRHWVDPMKPFAASLKPHLQGMAVTSATLRDHEGEDEAAWAAARMRAGADTLSTDIQAASFPSPFDYAAQTKIYIINDVNKFENDQVAGAYRALFEASRGGGLGLFTSIQRLRKVHEKIAPPLAEQEMTLYAQHIDNIDTGTLVDIFREDVHACLLGTDAVRDGVDVPGEALRLIVFDRVPWPRPTILHKARRTATGGREYDEMLTRLKLKQAFGRLIRRADDRGVFVMLDSGFPSRLHSAFPKDVEIIKTGLAEAIKGIGEFLA
ncbi:MAG: ATP-dependent DNA helicase [Alphaproteobacteria bacterium]